MDVDLRVVAVKLTNRFRGVRPAREGKHVRVIKIHLGQSKGVVEEGEGGEQRAVGGAGGQEIAAKQAWRGIKG